MLPYIPEGPFVTTPAPDVIHRAAGTEMIFQAMCIKCDEMHNLHIDLGLLKGVIPREEAAIGITEGRTKEFAILSRVGKPVSFQVLTLDHNGTAILSRRAAQQAAKDYFMDELRPGDVIPAVVQNTAPFGAFCDIGCGFPALMRIDRCCVSRLKSGTDLFATGQAIYAAVMAVDHPMQQIHLTGRELLGTWEENAAMFKPGQTVQGTVRSVMPYGIFVELTPNLSGLAEPMPGCAEGDSVIVYIRSILEERHKIKLNILEKLNIPTKPASLSYFVTSGHLDMWEYYPGSNAVTYF